MSAWRPVRRRHEQLRLHRGLTQEAFAEEARLSDKYYQAAEAGRKIDPRFSTLERLAKAHGPEVGQLLLLYLPMQAAAEPPAGAARPFPTRQQPRTAKPKRTRE